MEQYAGIFIILWW